MARKAPNIQKMARNEHFLPKIACFPPTFTIPNGNQRLFEWDRDKILQKTEQKRLKIGQNPLKIARKAPNTKPAPEPPFLTPNPPPPPQIRLSQYKSKTFREGLHNILQKIGQKRLKIGQNSAQSPKHPNRPPKRPF